MDKRIEHFKSLVDTYFCVSNIDDDEAPLFRSKDIREVIDFIIDYRNRYGNNWNENLLFHIDSEGGTTLMMIDVVHIELFV